MSILGIRFEVGSADLKKAVKEHCGIKDVRIEEDEDVAMAINSLLAAENIACIIAEEDDCEADNSDSNCTVAVVAKESTADLGEYSKAIKKLRSMTSGTPHVKLART